MTELRKHINLFNCCFHLFVLFVTAGTLMLIVERTQNTFQPTVGWDMVISHGDMECENENEELKEINEMDETITMNHDLLYVSEIQSVNYSTETCNYIGLIVDVNTPPPEIG